MMAPQTRSRGYLPHLESRNPVYFVTFRLTDSLPQKVLEQLQRERRQIEQERASLHSTIADRIRLSKLKACTRKAESCLDKGLGACYLRDPRIARIVLDAIRFFEGTRYRLLAWCIMPNHVHVVFSPHGNSSLEATMHSWKSYSAKRINFLLARRGRFWQREYFDHLVRSESSLRRIMKYVRDNPVKAHLRDWPWVSSG